jgi:hypothetical protein
VHGRAVVVRALIGREIGVWAWWLDGLRDVLGLKRRGRRITDLRGEQERTYEQHRTSVARVSSTAAPC